MAKPKKPKTAPSAPTTKTEPTASLFADGFEAARKAAVEIARFEIDSQAAKENGQAWVNCARALTLRLETLRVPE